MQILSKRYAELSAELQRQQAADGPAVWQGLVLGLCARGLTADQRALRDSCAAILNDAQPLPGALIAVITELSLDAQDGLEKNNVPLLQPAGSSAERLQALADLCYGLILGLAFDPKSSGTSRPTQKVASPKRLELLRTLQQLQQVDPSGELDEDDLNEVLSFIESELLREYQRSVKANA